MQNGSLQEIVTEVADSLGYCLQSEQKQAILSFFDGKDIFVSLPTGHKVMTTYRATKALRKSLTATMHTLCNNYIPLPQLMLHKYTRPFRGGGAGSRDYVFYRYREVTR